MKPIESILRVIDGLSQSTRTKLLKSNSIYSFQQNDEPVIFILHSGNAKLYRATDNFLLSPLSSPMIIGANLLGNETLNLYIQVEKTIEYEVVSRKNVEDVFSTKDLWRDVALLHMYLNSKFLGEMYNTSKLPAYEMVKTSLNEIISRRDHSSLNACEYVMERTLLSRSTVMKILKELRAGKYIDIHRGVLVAVHKLPDKF